MIPIHDRPQSLGLPRPFAGEHSEALHEYVRLPLLTGQQRRICALNRGNPAQSFAVARSDLVPDAPDVLPALKTDAVEKSFLQSVDMIVRPAVRKIHHVARLEPFVAAH